MTKLRKAIDAATSQEIEGLASAGLGPKPLASRKRSADGKIKSTIYLDPVVHQKLREIAFAHDVKMHDLFMRGLELVFHELGLPTVIHSSVKRL